MILSFVSSGTVPVQRLVAGCFKRKVQRLQNRMVQVQTFSSSAPSGRCVMLNGVTVVYGTLHSLYIISCWIVIGQEPLRLCGNCYHCYQILRCCSSRMNTTRSEACALMYLLMRRNFEFAHHKSFTRVHLQVRLMNIVKFSIHVLYHFSASSNSLVPIIIS